MVRLKITITGVKETQRALGKKAEGFVKQLDGSLGDIANDLRNEVVASIRGERSEPRSVDTGHFWRDTIFAVKKQDLVWVVFTNQDSPPYPKYLEFGTSTIEPRHHFTNSKNRIIPKAQEKLKQDFKRGIGVL